MYIIYYIQVGSPQVFGEVVPSTYDGGCFFFCIINIMYRFVCTMCEHVTKLPQWLHKNNR